MSSPALKRAAEERARQLLLRCDQIDSCRARFDESGPIEFSPEDVLREEEREQQKSSSSSLRSVVSSDDTRSVGTPVSSSPADASTCMSADDYRKVFRNMQENAALKNDKLNSEITSLKLELANARLELEQSTLALRNADKEKNELRSSLDTLIAGSEKATLTLGEENTVLAKKMQELRAERDALLLENTMLKNSSQHSDISMLPSSSQHSSTSNGRLGLRGGLSARIQRVKIAAGTASSRSEACSSGSVVSVETESITSDPTLEDCDGNSVTVEVAEVTTSSGPSLGFRASTLRN
mmetsp:Transcript_37597/g.82321  ORF Transcript_37597/g.82321 Transcript_37597/m.82321 type:complete len:296 (-) Transcript_37597:124-1011(-)